MSQLFTNHITLIGLGSQGLSWSMNLRDSGFNVDVWLRENSPSHVVREQLEFSKAKKFSSILLLLIPDNQHLNFLKEHEKEIPAGAAIIYGHGASCVEHELPQKFSKFNHLLLAPKAIASEVRFQFETHGKLGACMSSEFALSDEGNSNKEACEVLLKNLAKGIGITAGPYPTSFLDETRADLFSEQALLCGLMPYAARSSFNFLISKGIDPKVAYLECWHELKYIAKAMADCGPKDFFNLISPHALVGAHKASEIYFNDRHQKVLEELYKDIESGRFFDEASKANKENLHENIISEWEKGSLQKVHDELFDNLVSGI